MNVTRFKQGGAIQILFFIEEHGKSKIEEIVHDNKDKNNQSVVYQAIPILKELGLIEERKLKPFPPKRVFSLTEGENRR